MQNERNVIALRELRAMHVDRRKNTEHRIMAVVLRREESCLRAATRGRRGRGDTCEIGMCESWEHEIQIRLRICTDMMRAFACRISRVLIDRR